MSSRSARLLALLVLVTLGFVLGGCPGPTFIVQQYAGPERPAYTVATLRVDGDQPVRLLFLDDQDVAAPVVEDGRLHIEMLPGRHTVVVGSAVAPNERYVPIAFEAEAGRVYRVAFVGAEARVFEVSRSSDTLGRDVTAAAPQVDVPESRRQLD